MKTRGRAKTRKRAKRRAVRRKVSVRAQRAPRRTRARGASRVTALRWNPDPEDVQRSVVKLVLTLVEFIRKLMERQAIRRLEEETLTPQEIENVGMALMKLEQTVFKIAKTFRIDPKELNLDLGPVGRLH